MAFREVTLSSNSALCVCRETCKDKGQYFDRFSFVYISYTVESSARRVNMQTESELEKGECVFECAMGYVQALPVAIDEGLEQWLVVGDGLQYVAIIGHITDGPLAQACATQSEDVTVCDREDR